LHSKRQFGRKAGQARRYGKVRLRLVPLNASWYQYGFAQIIDNLPKLSKNISWAEKIYIADQQYIWATSQDGSIHESQDGGIDHL
jgi:hypothetical protein